MECLVLIWRLNIRVQRLQSLVTLVINSFAGIVRCSSLYTLYSIHAIYTYISVVCCYAAVVEHWLDSDDKDQPVEDYIPVTLLFISVAISKHGIHV